MENIILNGRTYMVSTEYDDMGAPWERDDGHGIVADWTSRDKHAGEWVLVQDHNSKCFYDYAGTILKAKAEGWGLNDDRLTALAAKLGRAPSKGELTAEAVRLDYEYLRGWANDEWNWVYVTVKAPDGEYETLGGLESTDDEGIAECAQELVERLESTFQDRQTEEATL